MRCVEHLLGYEAILLKILWSESIIAGETAHLNLWVFGLDKLRAKTQQDPCYAFAPFLWSNAETFHQHCLAIIYHTHRLQGNLSNIKRPVLLISLNIARLCVHGHGLTNPKTQSGFGPCRHLALSSPVLSFVLCALCLINFRTKWSNPKI